MRTHQKNPCSFCWAPIPVKSLTSHMATCDNSIANVGFSCDQCPFTSKRKDFIDSHIKTMHMNKKEETKETKAEPLKHSCKICKKELNTRKQFMDHVAEI